jgi:hypothetical protein
VIKLKKKVCIIAIILIVVALIAVSAKSMTLDEFNTMPIGSIVHLKLEYMGKTYLDGDGVVAYKLGESAGLASTNPNNNWSGAFNRSYLTIVSQPPTMNRY